MIDVDIVATNNMAAGCVAQAAIGHLTLKTCRALTIPSANIALLCILVGSLCSRCYPVPYVPLEIIWYMACTYGVQVHTYAHMNVVADRRVNLTKLGRLLVTTYLQRSTSVQ